MPEKADHPGRSLPIDALLPALERALEDHCTVLVQAPPGAGKTTRVPPALERAAWRNDRRIVMLEPRRLAARAAARFMARERGEDVGCTVGFRTRLETRVSKATRIEVVTDGVLVRMLQADPELHDCAAVVFDEFHERSLPADLGLVLVREAQQALREDLRVVVMSATLDAGPLSRFLGGPPVLTSEGRSFPVDIRWCPPRDGQRTVAAVAAAVRRALADESGSVLVFLPGVGEIRRVGGALDALPDDVDVRPLFGALPPDEQDAAIAPAPAGRRKIVLATAIAETSLTIEGIGVVVDAGLARSARAGALESGRRPAPPAGCAGPRRAAHGHRPGHAAHRHPSAPGAHAGARPGAGHGPDGGQAGRTAGRTRRPRPR